METTSPIPDPGREMSLPDVVDALRRRWLLVVGGVFAVAVATVFYSLSIPNQYASTAAIVIRNPEIPITGEAAPLSAEMVVALAEADSTKMSVFRELMQRRELPPQMTFQGFQTMMQTQTERKRGPDQSLVPMIRMTARSTDPELAMRVADAWTSQVLIQTRTIYSAGVDSLAKFIDSASTKTEGSLRLTQQELTSATVTADLAAKRARHAEALATYTASHGDLQKMLLDQRLQGALLVEADRIVSQEVTPEGQWVGHIWYERCLLDPGSPPAGVTSATEPILNAVTRLVANRQALEEFLQTKEIHYKTTQMANLNALLESISASILSSQDSVALAQAQYEALSKALQTIDQKVVLNKAISDDALWTAYLEGRLPAGDKILPLKEEMYNPLYGDVLGRVVTIGADMEGQRKRNAYYEGREAAVRKEISELSREISRLEASRSTLQGAVAGDQAIFTMFESQFRTKRQAREEIARKMAEIDLRIAALAREVELSHREMQTLNTDILGMDSLLSDLRRRNEDFLKVADQLASRSVDVTLLKVSAEQASRSGAVRLYSAEANPLKVAPARSRLVVTATSIALLAAVFLAVVLDRVGAVTRRRV